MYQCRLICRCIWFCVSITYWHLDPHRQDGKPTNTCDTWQNCLNFKEKGASSWWYSPNHPVHLFISHFYDGVQFLTYCRKILLEHLLADGKYRGGSPGCVFSLLILCMPSYYACAGRYRHAHFSFFAALLSTPMGVDYVVIGFDMEVQP